MRFDAIITRCWSEHKYLENSNHHMVSLPWSPISFIEIIHLFTCENGAHFSLISDVNRGWNSTMSLYFHWPSFDWYLECFSWPLNIHNRSRFVKWNQNEIKIVWIEKKDFEWCWRRWTESRILWSREKRGWRKYHRRKMNLLIWLDDQRGYCWMFWLLLAFQKTSKRCENLRKLWFSDFAWHLVITRASSLVAKFFCVWC